MTIRILFADDHPLVRSGLAALIGSQDDMQIAGQAVDGADALAKFRACAPDVTLLDLNLPDIRGIAVAETIRRESPEARIVFLTSYSRSEDVRLALATGARGYLLKEALEADLLAAIRTVHAGGCAIPAEIAARLAESVSQAAMTRRERDVLDEMAKGLGNEEIGSRLGIAEETVKTHVKSLFAKLKARDRAQAVVAAIKRGLVRLD